MSLRLKRGLAFENGLVIPNIFHIIALIVIPPLSRVADDRAIYRACKRCKGPRDHGRGEIRGSVSGAHACTARRLPRPGIAKFRKRSFLVIPETLPLAQSETPYS